MVEASRHRPRKLWRKTRLNERATRREPVTGPTGLATTLRFDGANSPAKPPAMPERIEAVLQLRELGRRITTISSGEPRGPQGDRNVTGS